MMGFGGAVVLIAGAMFWELTKNSRLAWKEFGLSFIWMRQWDPVAEVFGALPFIYGTLVSSAIAMAIAIPLGLGSALFLAEMAPRKISDALTFLIELLAAIPSVILGLMGIFILVPTVKWFEPILIKYLGFLPFFRGTPYGVGLLTAGFILSIMILPYITTISRDVLLSVPRSLKEGALALGATHWETVRLVIYPFSRSAILGAVFLALGRALGETMAVTMVIGNTPKISLSLFDPSYSMSAVLANEFAEATSDLHVHSLIAIALVLFCITIVVNGLARLMIYRVAVKGGKK
jgi:phosphate transport system permease protein